MKVYRIIIDVDPDSDTRGLYDMLDETLAEWCDCGTRGEDFCSMLSMSGRIVDDDLEGDE